MDYNMLAIEVHGSSRLLQCLLRRVTQVLTSPANYEKKVDSQIWANCQNLGKFKQNMNTIFLGFEK